MVYVNLPVGAEPRDPTTTTYGIQESKIERPRPTGAPVRRSWQLRKNIDSYVILVMSIGATTISHETSFYYALLLFQDH